MYEARQHKEKSNRTIGCGDAGACKNITISGGTIVATKGSNSPSSIGACLATSPTGTVTIDMNNADVTEN